MHEDLLGYLLGALEPDEMQRISDWLKDNPEGQAQLEQIERGLRPLEDGFEAIEAPSQDLLDRTLAGIPEGVPPTAESDQGGRTGSGLGPTVTLTDVDLSGEAGPGGSRWSVMDSIGGLLSVATLLALLLPTIAAGRFQARKVACGEQLRELGTVLMQYVYRDRYGQLPQVAESGPEAFAGMYAIRLADAGLLSDANQRWCPSADLPVLSTDQFADSNQTPSKSLVSLTSLPPAASLAELPVNDLRQIQQIAGGHYAYSLGVIGDDGYSSPRFEGRTSFAVMADAPLSQSGHSGEFASLKFSHGGEGANVLYEDGGVRFIRGEALDSMPDNPFVNHTGASEAGVNIDDASVSPSWRGPFTISIQR